MNIGFIGSGNMAGAIIGGILNQQLVSPQEVFCADTDPDKRRAYAEKLGITACDSNEALVEACDVVVLAIKPQVIPSALPPLRTVLLDKQPLIISLAAGVSLDTLAGYLNAKPPLAIVRVMPNINALVGGAVTAVCPNAAASEAQVETVRQIFNAVGTAVDLAEKDIATFSGIAGCSPAYAYLFIDSLARAAVKNGLPKDLATKIAAQAVLGSAKMVLESDEHPWTLIDRVCSPGGTTIAGLYTLEENAFMATVMKGVDASIRRDQEMSQQK